MTLLEFVVYGCVAFFVPYVAAGGDPVAELREWIIDE